MVKKSKREREKEMKNETKEVKDYKGSGGGGRIRKQKKHTQDEILHSGRRDIGDGIIECKSWRKLDIGYLDGLRYEGIIA